MAVGIARILVEMIDSFGVGRARPPDDAVDCVFLREQQQSVRF